MGAWGYGPLQNDSAADWLGDIGEYCSAQVAQVLDMGRMDAEWEEVRAACWLLERLGDTYVWPTEAFIAQVRQGIDWLMWLRDESGWHEDWNKPNDLRVSLDAQISTLTQMLTETESNANPDTQE